MLRKKPKTKENRDLGHQKPQNFLACRRSQCLRRLKCVFPDFTRCCSHIFGFRDVARRSACGRRPCRRCRRTRSTQAAASCASAALLSVRRSRAVTAWQVGAPPRSRSRCAGSIGPEECPRSLRGQVGRDGRLVPLPPQRVHDDEELTRFRNSGARGGVVEVRSS